MDNFLFTHPMEVRYGDLDPQWHLNNARYLSFFEQGRFAYLIHLGLWDGKSFLELKSIIADIHISFLAPITLTQKLLVGVKVAQIGSKSLTFHQELADAETGEVFSRSETVIVTFDYHTQKSIPVPNEWREKITAFESGFPSG
ncbi:MAG: acyl-CoA thioesterase [Anaerolineaceae bacterium]